MQLIYFLLYFQFTGILTLVPLEFLTVIQNKMASTNENFWCKYFYGVEPHLPDICDGNVDSDSDSESKTVNKSQSNSKEEQDDTVEDAHYFDSLSGTGHSFLLLPASSLIVGDPRSFSNVTLIIIIIIICICKAPFSLHGQRRP